MSCVSIACTMTEKMSEDRKTTFSTLFIRSIIIMTTSKCHKLERAYRDCIKRESMVSLNP